MFSTAMICASAYIFGVLISAEVSLTTLVMLVFGMIAAAMIVSAVFKHVNGAAFLAAAFVLLGGVRCYNAFENRLYYEFPDKYVTVTGNITSTPMKASGTYKYRYTLSADKIEYLGKTYAVNSKIRLSTKNLLEYGERVQASGFLKELPRKNNETDFDTRAYYGSLGIKTRLAAYELASVKNDGGERFSVIGKIKSGLYTGITKHYSGDNAALLCAVTLGDKTWFGNDYRTHLLNTGVLNSVFSPYIHVIILTAFASLLFGKFGAKPREFALLCIFTLYALFNSTSPTVLKTAFLGAVLILHRRIFNFSDKTEALCIIVLIMTVIDPLLCFNGGFVISSASTFMVYNVYGIVKKRVVPILKKIHVGANACTVFVIWLCTAVGTLPLSAYYFNGVSLYGMLLSPLFVPCICVILFSAPILFLIPGAYETLPALVKLFDAALRFIKLSPYAIEKLPFYHLILGKPQILEIVVFYVALWIVVRILKGKLKTDGTKLLVTVLSAFALCIVMDFGANSLNIYFVNVGQGDGAVLHTDAGETVLIDGGGASAYQDEYNIGERVYLPYLTAHGFTRIDTAIVSHYHKDHAEGIIAAAENLNVRMIVMPDTSPENVYRKKLEEIAAERGIKIEYAAEGDVFEYKSGLKIKVLAPDAEQLSGNDENDTSIVAEVHYGEFTALFTGDSGDEADGSYARNIDLLKVAHHGSETANGEAFVQHVRPRYAVISVGENNDYNLPSKRVVARYTDAGTSVLRTDVVGDIHFKVGKNGGMKYSSFRGE